MCACVCLNLQNMIDYLKKFSDETLRGRLLFDINLLSIAPSDDVFIVACNLFMSKWKEISTTPGVETAVGEAVTHFREVWLTERVRYWYSGASRGHVLNNSGLEGCNGSIKVEISQHLLLLLLDFLRKSMNFFHNESMRRNPDNVNFVGVDIDEPKLSRSIQETASQLTRRPHHFVHVTLKNDDDTAVDMYVCLTVSNPRIPSEELALNVATRLHKNRWESFDQYAKDFTDTRVIQRSQSDAGNWRGLTCTCYEFAKQFVCAEVLAISNRDGKFDIPREYQVLFGN